MVSFSDSPLSTLEPEDLRLIVSADRRLAASSNELDVRVDASKKTFITVRPRSVGTFLTSRCITDSNPSAIPSTRSTAARSRSPIEIRWRRGRRAMGGCASTGLLLSPGLQDDTVGAVGLPQVDVDALGARGGHVLADVVGPDRQL